MWLRFKPGSLECGFRVYDDVFVSASTFLPKECECCEMIVSDCLVRRKKSVGVVVVLLWVLSTGKTCNCCDENEVEGRLKQ
jgi:hypothetical protein